MGEPAKPGADGQSSGAFDTVNQHCLESIVQLSEDEEVIAAEDIYDAQGHKLWAKGYAVSRKLQEKLLMRRLARPLEATLSVEAGATMKTVVADCLQRLESNPTLGALAGWSDARALLRGVESMPLPGPLKLLLTSVRKLKQERYATTLATMITCAGLASRLKLSDHDASMLILAALVHDIGEMYINPDYLSGGTVLNPAEWKHVASHPRVGHAFIREFTTFPAVVANCVQHHHERLDGSGYPFQVSGTKLDRLDRLLAAADSVAAIAARGSGDARDRIALALRIVPDEFDRAVVTAINESLRPLATNSPPAESATDCVARVVPVLERLGAARIAAEKLLSQSDAGHALDPARYVLSVLATIDRSVRATGLSEISQLKLLEGDAAIAREIWLVLGEVGWRLRNLARNVYLRAESRGLPDEMGLITPLVQALDGPPAAPDLSAPAGSIDATGQLSREGDGCVVHDIVKG